MSNMQLTPRANKVESNLILDGGMEIWLEGTSIPIANNAALYSSVLMKLNNGNSGVTMTGSRQTSIPSGTNLQFSNQISKTVSGTLAASTLVAQIYNIEGYDLDRIINNEWSVIFWVKSSVASNRSVSVKNDTQTHSYVQQYNISATNTWQLKVLKFPAMSTCPGTLQRTTGAGVNLSWNIVNGSNTQTASLNQWLSGSFWSGIGEDSTWLTGTTHDFSLTGIMVLPGDWTELQNHPSMYEFVRAGKNISEEENMIMRYYEVWTGRARGALQSGTNEYPFPMKHKKRAQPTVVFSPSSGNSPANISADGFAWQTTNAASGDVTVTMDARF